MKKVVTLTLCALSFGIAAHAAPQAKGGAKKPMAKMTKTQMQKMHKMRQARLAKIKATSAVKAKVMSATPPAACAHGGMTADE